MVDVGVRRGVEYRPRPEREARQLSLLNEMIETARERTEFYCSLPARRLDSLDELAELPLTTKAELREAGYAATLIRSPNSIRELHTSSGTTGKPSVFALTERDLRRSREALARTWRMHGVSEGDLVQLMVSYGMFTAGLLNQYAIQELGAGVVPAGIQSTTRQLSTIERFEPDYLVCVSTYFLRIAHVMEQHNVEFPHLKGLVGGGVPVTERMKRHLEDRFGAPFYNQYGLAEIDTGIAGECVQQDGLHVQADYVYPEVVDPETHEPLPEGEEGLLVLTPLRRDGQAVIRYLTNDITAIHYNQCACGRTTPRIEDPRGRADDVVFVKGTKLDVSDLQGSMEAIDDVVDPFEWQLKIDREGGKDVLELHVRWATDRPRPTIVREHLRSHLGLSIDRVESGSLIEDRTHKHQRLRDTRTKP